MAIPQPGDRLRWETGFEWVLTSHLRPLSDSDADWFSRRTFSGQGRKYLYTAKAESLDGVYRDHDVIFECLDIDIGESGWTFIETPFERLVRETLDQLPMGGCEGDGEEKDFRG